MGTSQQPQSKMRRGRLAIRRTLKESGWFHPSNFGAVCLQRDTFPRWKKEVLGRLVRSDALLNHKNGNIACEEHAKNGQCTRQEPLKRRGNVFERARADTLLFRTRAIFRFFSLLRTALVGRSTARRGANFQSKIEVAPVEGKWGEGEVFMRFRGQS